AAHVADRVADPAIAHDDPLRRGRGAGPCAVRLSGSGAGRTGGGGRHGGGEESRHDAEGRERPLAGGAEHGCSPFGMGCLSPGPTPVPSPDAARASRPSRASASVADVTLTSVVWRHLARYRVAT